MLKKAAEKAPAASASSADVSPYSKWDSITLDLPKNKIAPQEGTQKVSAAALAQAIAGAQEEDLSRTKSKRRAKIDVTLTGDDFAVPAGEEPEDCLLYTSAAMAAGRKIGFCKNYALPTEPNSSIFSLTVALMASVPGASSLRGSKPLPC